MKRRLLSGLLTLCLLLGLLPTAALAAEEHGGHGEEWTAITAGTTALTDGSYYLSEGVMPGSNLTVTGTATLCLNGQALNQYIDVQNGGSLTICDCSEEGSGKISGSFSSYVIKNYGTLVLESGAVENTGYGYGISNSGSLTITGGSVTASGDDAVYNSGALTITGGSVTTGSSSDYAIYHSSAYDLILGGSPTINGDTGYGDVCLGSYDNGSIDAGGPGGETNPYAGAALTVKSSSSYPNGITAVKNVTDSNKNLFSSGNSNYTLTESGGSLVFQGKTVTLTWKNPGGTEITSDEAYPTTAEYGAALSALPEYTEDGKVFLGWANSYGELLTTSTRITGDTTFTAKVVAVLPGSGTAESPYELDSPEDLAALRDMVDSGNAAYNSSSVYYRLTGSIDLSSVCGAGKGNWTPIGRNSSKAFKANFDGNGETISNLYISGSSEYQGLFGYVCGTYNGHAVIKDLTLSGSVTGDESVGLLAGYANYAHITGCTVTGTVAGSDDFGPLVGKIGSNVTQTNNQTSGVTAAPVGYTTDDNGIMAYQRDSYSSTTYDIKGFYNGSWIQTTYSNDGYEIAKENLDGATVSVEPVFLNNGQYVQMNYTVTAGASGVTDGKLAVHADVQIGDNDNASIETITDRSGKAIGLRMVDTHTSCNSKDAQFNLYFDGTGGVTPVDTYWFGYYGARDDSLTVNGQSTYRYFLQLDASSAYASGGTYAADYSSYSGGDSGLAFSWQNITLEANESKTFSVVVGVGTKADPPVWGDYTTDGGQTRPVVTLAVEENQSAFQVKARVQDAAGLTDTLYYSVETSSGVYSDKDNVALVSKAATGSMQELAGQISTADYPAGTYTFSFWVGNSAGALSDAVTKTLTIGEGGKVSGLDIVTEPDPPNSVNYTVNHWQQNLNAADDQSADNYTLEATEDLTGTTATQVTPAVKTYEGFTAPATQTVTIAAEGSTVVNYYYTRNSYTVTLNKGTGVDTVTGADTYQYGETVTINAMVSDGYAWSKWSDGNTNQERTFTMGAEKISLTAQAKVIVYDITYNLDGGTVSGNPTSYTVETASFTLENPTRTGYTFAGWTGTGLTGASNTVTILKGSTGDRSYTATWTPNTYTVTFHASDGGETEAVTQSFTYDITQNLTENTFSRQGYKFSGWNTAADGSGTWYADQASVINLTAEAGGAIDLYAQWTEESKYTVSGSVTDGTNPINPVSGATVTLKQGNTTIAATTTDADGSYLFTNVPAGVYNIVATQGEKTVTILVTVTDGDLSNADLTLRVSQQNSVVEITGEDTPDVVVGGLDEIAKNDGSGNSIEIKMTVTAKEDVTGSSQAEDEALKTQQTAIKDQAPGKTIQFIDLTLTKTEGSSAATDIGDSNTQLLTIVIPFETGNKENITVYRYHGTSAEALPASANADGEYFTVGEKAVTIYAKKFSTYAIGYTVPGGNGGNGGGGVSTGYPPIVKDTDHGTVSIDPSRPTSGSSVTITPKADEGYAVEQVTVVDRDGRPVEVTLNKDGTWSFRQPVGQVTITVTFRPVFTVSDCPRDDTCPLAQFTDAIPDAWYHDGVHYCVEQGLMVGTGGTTFAPDQNISRAMIATILWRLAGSPVVSGPMTYEDVEQGRWYSEAIRWATGEGVAAGYGNGRFGPDDAITREQLCTMLWRYAGSPGAETSLSGYTDADSVSEYARGAMAWAVEQGIMTGITSTTLSPRGMATRAQAATMLMRLCEGAAE